MVRYESQRQVASASQSAPRFALAPEVHKADQEGGARLFDFGRGRFYAVDSIGACILRRLLALPLPQAIATVAADFGVAEDRVRTDALSLAGNLAKRGLLIERQDRGGSHDEQKRHILAAAKALWRGALRRTCGRLLHAASRRFSADAPRRITLRTTRRLLRLAWASLRLLGWQESIRLWRQLPQPTTPEFRKADEVTPALDELIREAASGVFLTPAACKERALVGWSLLRNCYGLPAEMVIGFEPYPFGLHAWVECDGVVLTDDSARCERYQQIVRYA